VRGDGDSGEAECPIDQSIIALSFGNVTPRLEGCTDRGGLLRAEMLKPGPLFTP